MMQPCWKLTVTGAGHSWSRLFATSEQAVAFPGTDIQRNFTVIVEQTFADVVFVVLTVGDHHDGGDDLLEVCETYVGALRVAGAQRDECRIECKELRR